jgi:hypothetical protein
MAHLKLHPGSEIKSQLKDLGCNNVLRGQGYVTHHGILLDEYGAMVEIRPANKIEEPTNYMELSP